MLGAVVSVSRVLVVLTCIATASVARGETISSAAKYARLEDYQTGTVLFDKSGDEPMSPASTSKLLVAEIVFHGLKEGQIKLDDKYHVSDYAWRTGGAKAHGSTMFLKVKSDVAVEDLLRGLIIQSGNDAAIVLAEGLGGSVENFVALMNKRARELGMTHSHFANVWGKDEVGETVTSADMALLTRHLIKEYPEYYHYFGEKDFTWTKIRQLNRNPLLTMNIGADGLKTGDTDEAGFGLVGSAVQDAQRLILVVNGYKTAAERAEDSRKLLNWGFKAFDVRTLFQPGDTVGRARVYGGAVDTVELTPQATVKAFVLRAGAEKLTARIVYLGPAPAPVEAGRPLGELRIYQGDTLALRAPLQTKNAVPVGGLTRRAADAAWQFGADWLRRAWKP